MRVTIGDTIRVPARHPRSKCSGFEIRAGFQFRAPCKAASSKREVLLLGGDLHVSVYSAGPWDREGTGFRSCLVSLVPQNNELL